jgi:DNA adenine methylase
MQVKKGDFVYLDPPYAKEGGRFRGEYGYGAFCVEDIHRLLECIAEIDHRGAKFLLSYSYCKEIRRALDQWFYKAILVRRHVAGFGTDRRTIREVLVANFSLK